MNRWVLEQIKPEISLEAKMTKLKLSYFRHIMRRQGVLENATMLGKMEGRRGRGRSNMRWIDFIKEARGMMSLQELSGVTEDRTWGMSLCHEVPRELQLTQQHRTNTIPSYFQGNTYKYFCTII